MQYQSRNINSNFSYCINACIVFISMIIVKKLNIFHKILFARLERCNDANIIARLVFKKWQLNSNICSNRFKFIKAFNTSLKCSRLPCYYAVCRVVVSQLQCYNISLAADISGCLLVCEGPRHSL